MNKVPKLFRNFYFLTGVLFLSWMTLIDSNDFFTQIKLSTKVKELKREKAFYKEKIKEVNAERDALNHNPDLLEKLAREKYLMKKKDEDLYVLVPKD